MGLDSKDAGSNKMNEGDFIDKRLFYHDRI